MLKNIFKQSNFLKSLKYYGKKYFNGDLLYLSVKTSKNGRYLGAFIIDLDIEKSFTSVSAMKTLVFTKENQILSKVKINRKNDFLMKFESLDENIFKFPFPKNDDNLVKNVEKGDIFVSEEKNINYLNIALSELSENDEKMIKIGEIINLTGFAILDEIRTNILLYEGLIIEELCTARRKTVAKLINYYVFCSIFIIFLINFYYSDNLMMPLLEDERVLSNM